MILNMRINSALKKNKRKHTFLNLDKMRRVLILFSYQDLKEINEIAKDLESKGKSVILWTVYPSNTGEKPPFIPKVRIISPKEISVIWGLSSAVIKEFCDQEYDTLLDLTTEADNSISFLLAKNTSQFCIGLKKQEKKIFDFILHKEENRDLIETYDQLKLYLHNIQ
jgi:hypothetical protein